MLWLLTLTFILFSQPAHATEEFTTTENIQYSVHSSTNTTVTQKVSLTNNFSQIYLQEYVIKLNGSSVANIKASDSAGNILHRIEKQNDQTSIFLKFNRPAVGKGQSTNFSLSYSLDDFVTTKGQTYEMQLPDYRSADILHNIDVDLSVPASFGPISFANSTYSSHSLNNILAINLKSVQKLTTPALLVFGNHQIFDFRLKYFLRNDSQVPIKTEIVVPPDTPGQNVVYTKINPLPLQVTVDPDGNWLAEYLISGNSDIAVEATGQVKIIPPRHSSSTINISDYLSNKPFWPTNDPHLISVAKSLKSPQQIYQFVVNTLSYDYQKINSSTRVGGAQALANPQNSLCSEFTDLFVTLSRINGIPAREVEGFAYSNNPKIKPTNPGSDVLHAWPQFYDINKKVWISVDPTWEKTTKGIDYFHDLDLNHFAFVFHGLESDYPYPPGSHKKDSSERAVFVDFAKTEISPSYLPPKLALNQNQLIISNPNPNALHHLQINRQSWNTTIDVLPPSGITTVTLPQPHLTSYFSFQSQNQKYNITISETGATSTITLVNRQYYLVLSATILILIFILSTSGIIITIKRHNEKNH